MTVWLTPEVGVRAVNELGAVLRLELLHLGILRHAGPVFYDALQDGLRRHHAKPGAHLDGVRSCLERPSSGGERLDLWVVELTRPATKQPLRRRGTVVVQQAVGGRGYLARRVALGRVEALLLD